MAKLSRIGNLASLVGGEGETVHSDPSTTLGLHLGPCEFFVMGFFSTSAAPTQ